MSIFLKAAEIIEKQGWMQHAYANLLPDGSFDKSGPVCLVGACNLAAHGTILRFGADRFEKSADYAKLLAILNTRGFGGVYIHHWNDAFTRTKEEVIALLREAHDSVSVS